MDDELIGVGNDEVIEKINQHVEKKSLKRSARVHRPGGRDGAPKMFAPADRPAEALGVFACFRRRHAAIGSDGRRLLSILR